jgi:WhiB family transcriptional regulator, redox-sensing transcriptional regulator
LTDRDHGRQRSSGTSATTAVAFAAEVPVHPRHREGRTLVLERLGEGLLEGLEPDLGWDHQAGCRSHDPTLFFGPNRFEPKRERLAREAEAKAVCATCPCLAACREYALSAGELYGVWGGLGETDRRELLADRGTIAAAV